MQSLEPFPAMNGAAFLLIHPGFGISTAWAYQTLAHYPKALNGQLGRAEKLISLLRTSDLKTAATEFYNSLEAPALVKYPLLILFQEHLRANGAAVALMSGSGSTTFAVAESLPVAEKLAQSVREKFGSSNWMAVVPV